MHRSTPKIEPRAAYIHVPFCAHRCGYCDFTLVAGRDELVPKYLESLERELHSLETPRDVDTLFLGGGTPTHLSEKELASLLEILRRWFRLTDGAEVSVEANPYGLTKEKVSVLAEFGVNRVSLGVQSFEPGTLAFLERDHREPEITESVAAVKTKISNLSLDLIFGVPGQLLDEWRMTLRKALSLEPQHLSTYGLTIERGTAFWSRRAKGAIVPVPDELGREMYAAAMDDLAAAGFEQYEISSFAKRGFACRHNGVYWAGLPYYGFGPGAARYIRGKRETNHRSVTTWIRRVLAGESPVGETEELSPEDRARELLVLGLRRTAGLSRDDFCDRTGFDVDGLAGDVVTRFVRRGLLEDTGHAVRLTREGRFVADSVAAEFL